MKGANVDGRELSGLHAEKDIKKKNREPRRKRSSGAFALEVSCRGKDKREKLRKRQGSGVYWARKDKIGKNYGEN